MTYQVKLTTFEGPLDLLLQLIEQRQLDITTVSLAAVTDQYLEHLSLLTEIDAASLAHFLVIAAKLLLIKSQALLPRPPLPEAKEAEEDVGEALARQLLEYKRFKEIAGLLRERDEDGLHSYLRLASTHINGHFRLEGVSLVELAQAMVRVLSTLPGEVEAPPLPTRVYSIADKIAAIEEWLCRGPVSFERLLSQASSKGEAIVTFLALLELIKQGQVLVEQAEMFGDITITRAPLPAPQ